MVPKHLCCFGSNRDWPRIGKFIERLEQNVQLFLEVNMGATGIGTGINAEPGYSDLCIKHLCDVMCQFE